MVNNAERVSILQILIQLMKKSSTIVLSGHITQKAGSTTKRLWGKYNANFDKIYIFEKCIHNFVNHEFVT